MQLAGLWLFRMDSFEFKAQARIVGSLLSQLAGMWLLRVGSFISGVRDSCYSSEGFLHSWSVYKLCEFMAVHTMAANFLYLLEEKGIAKDVIDKLQSVGITTMSRLALWVDTREELRGVMKELGFDPSADLEDKLKTVTVMDAWESSKQRNEEEDRIHAEASSGNVPKSLEKQEHLQLRNSVGSKYQTLHDLLCPSSGLMDKVLGMIEENHLELVALWTR